MFIAQIFVWLLSFYAAMGLIFALIFATSLIGRLDSSAKQSSWRFRLIILPGAVALWPLLLWRLMRGIDEPPVEHTVHRKIARRNFQ